MAEIKLTKNELRNQQNRLAPGKIPSDPAVEKGDAPSRS